jgi:hypothetical protein
LLNVFFLIMGHDQWCFLVKYFLSFDGTYPLITLCFPVVTVMTYFKT